MINFILMLLLTVSIILILVYSIKNISNTNQQRTALNKLYIINIYQFSEIIIGTTLFFIVYSIYLLINYGKVLPIDLLYTTITFGIILASGNIANNWIKFNNNNS